MKQILKSIISFTGGVLFFFRKKKVKINEIKKILIISLYFKGDTLFITPSISMLSVLIPGALIDVWVKSRSRELLEGNDKVRNIIVFDEIKTSDYNDNKDLHVLHKLSFLKDLRKQNYDLIIDLTGKYSTALFTMLSGVKISIGLNYNGFGFGYSNFVNIDTQNTSGHLAEKYLRVLKEGLEVSDEVWEDLRKKADAQYQIYISDKSKNTVTQLFQQLCIDRSKPLICIQTSAGWKAKEWGQHNFSELLTKFSKDYEFILIGSESDREYNYKIIDEVDQDLRALFVSLPLNTNSEIIRRSDIFIGSDSIGLHIAGAVGTPSIGLFGPTNPLFSNPQGGKHLYIYKKLYCSAAEDKQYCTRDAGKTCPAVICMNSITSDEILQKIKYLLEKYPDEKPIQLEKN